VVRHYDELVENHVYKVVAEPSPNLFDSRTKTRVMKQ